MTLAEIVAMVRDEAGVVGEGRVHTNFIRALVNQAQKDFARQTGLFIKEAQRTLVANQDTYVLGTGGFNITDFQRPQNVEVTLTSGERVRVFPMDIQEELDHFSTLSNPNISGAPAFYIMLGLTAIRFRPKPDAAYNILLRYYAVPPNLINFDDATIIPEQYEMTIINWCIYRIKKKLGHANANDYLALYMEEIADAIADRIKEDEMPRMRPPQDIRGADGIRIP